MSLLRWKRVGPGYYTAGGGRFEVVQTENGDWYWLFDSRPAQDIYATRAHATDDCEAWVYSNCEAAT